jgi:TatD DNase family protein
MLVDVHCHLEHVLIKDKIDNIIKKCRENNVIAITSGVNPGTNKQALEIGKRYPDVVKVSLGLYPIDALEAEINSGEFPRVLEKFNVDDELKFIESKKNEIIAIGEAGVDFHWNQDKKQEQLKTFEKVIELAVKINKPLIVHSRKGEKEAVDLLESFNIKKVVMHCFNGNFKLVKKVEDNGWYLSIPAVIIRNLHFQGVVNLVSINNLLTETDSPYLAPPPLRVNEPYNVIKTIEKIAELKNMDVEEVKKNIYMNYQNLFLK